MDRKGLIAKAVNNFYNELTASTPIYRMYFTLKGNDKKIYFADFYGKTVIPDNNGKVVISDDDKRIQTRCQKIKEYITATTKQDNLIDNINCDVDWFQFGGEDHKNHSILSNALYCKEIKEALNYFEFFYDRSKKSEVELEDEDIAFSRFKAGLPADDDKALDNFIESDLFKKFMNS